MTIICPRCGLAFESQAKTNTRCRRCRHVVRVGRSPARPAVRQLDVAAIDDITADEPTVDEAAAALAVLTSVVAAVLVIVVPKIIEAVRRWRGDRAPTSAHDGPEAAQWNPDGQCATGAHTWSDGANDEGAT